MARLVATYWWGGFFLVLSLVSAGSTYSLPKGEGAPSAVFDEDREAEEDEHCGERLCAAWWRKDDAHLRTLRRHLAPSKLTVLALRRAVERGDLDEDNPIRNGGFGVTVWDLALYGGGYVSVRFSVVHFEGEFLEYRVQLDVGDTPGLKEAVDKIWQTPDGAESTRSDRWISERLVSEGVKAKLEARLARELGPQVAAQVPERLGDAYRALLDGVEDGYVTWGCGIAPIPPLALRGAREMVAAQRVDLLTNLLRGPSPTGRIYAASALRWLEAQGLRLEEATLQTLNRVEALALDVTTCKGCIVESSTTPEALALLTGVWELQ